MSTNETTKPDYRDTLFLPRTEFPMRAGLPKREPEWLARWEAMNLYARLRQNAKGREKYVLHDGPPYANGNVHMGTALNKILKDIVVRSQQMMGKDANYVPGWDCHGLPIEWKIEERYREAGRSKDEVPVVEFRKECREFAAHWLDVQREEFKRLGVVGDWDNPYTTMAYEAEAAIVREFLKFVMNGSLYRGSKPVMWSVVEKTALAEAEVEYHEHVSPAIHVRFPVVTAGDPVLEGAAVVIWTTTPWTIPGNRAIAYHDDISYGVYEVTAAAEKSLAAAGERLVIADVLAEEVAKDANVSHWTRVSDAKGIAGTVCAHPLRGKGYDFDVPLLNGGFVTTEQGTGFVHIAPGHGADDFELGVRHGIEVPFTIDEEGRYLEHVAEFAGRVVVRQDGSDGDANEAVVGALRDAGALLALGRLEHQYPHSWRSKAPLIFRNTPQWFVSMKTNGLRDKALKAIDDTRWYPETGRNRIRGMVENRPDWVLSRQRAWGVPLTCFVNRENGALLQDPAVNERIVAAVEENGTDVWFETNGHEFLEPDYRPQDWEKVTDILDVWFDSGSTHAFVLETRNDLKWPADLYLEGSDQHRGWFQSSLLEACGTRGRAPFDAVLTHGFIIDEGGHKMSKSGGNAVQPQAVSDQNGAEILRLWVASSDFTGDLKMSPDIIKANVDSYRKLRNTVRFLLSNLDGFAEDERLAFDEMPELERWLLHRLTEIDAIVRDGYNGYDFTRVFWALFNFCTIDLSAIYFDIRKDALYCDARASIRRRAARTVLDHLFSCLTVWLAPILCFTMEEAWLSRFPSDDDSVHLQLFPDLPASWRNEALGEKWHKVRQVRRAITGAIEIERKEKRVGKSLEAAPTVYIDDPGLVAALDGIDLAEVAITSNVGVIEGKAPDGAFVPEDGPAIGVVVGHADGSRCERCWMVLPEVGDDPAHPDLCRRCSEVVAA